MSLHSAVRLPDRIACLAAIHAALIAGQDVNSREGLALHTPLCSAMRNREPSAAAAAITALLSAGANVRAEDRFGKEALHYAAGSPNAKAAAAAIEALLAAGADVRARAMDSDGMEPLHYAARNPYAEAAVAAIKALVAAGADVRAKDDNGREPMHSAVQNTSAKATVAAMQALLSAGTDAWAKNKRGYTPLRLLMQKNPNPSDLSWSLNDGDLMASVLLAAGPTDAALEDLRSASSAYAELLLPDFIVSRAPLTAAQWASVWEAAPDPCPGLGRTLPTALACSADQARQLVRRLPPADAQRLRAFLLCPGLLQRRCGPSREPLALPPDVFQCILGFFVGA